MIGRRRATLQQYALVSRNCLYSRALPNPVYAGANDGSVNKAVIPHERAKASTKPRYISLRAAKKSRISYKKPPHIKNGATRVVIPPRYRFCQTHSWPRFRRTPMDTHTTPLSAAPLKAVNVSPTTQLGRHLSVWPLPHPLLPQ